jgi:hypothetical protein
LFLGLLLLHVAGFTLLTFLSSWESENTIVPNQLIQIKGDSLIHKYQISLPYSNSFERYFDNGQTAVFEGKFYQSQKVEYRNDTLLTYYIQANYTRENVLAIARNFSDSLMLDFSKEKNHSSQKNMEFFKKISKDYFTGKIILNCWFWNDYQLQKYFNVASFYKNPEPEVRKLPPILKVS